jgi:hypothetical protein
MDFRSKDREDKRIFQKGFRVKYEWGPEWSSWVGAEGTLLDFKPNQGAIYPHFLLTVKFDGKPVPVTLASWKFTVLPQSLAEQVACKLIYGKFN